MSNCYFEGENKVFLGKEMLIVTLRLPYEGHRSKLITNQVIRVPTNSDCG